MVNNRWMNSFVGVFILWILWLWLPETIDTEVKNALIITLCIIVLFIFEPLPYGQISLFAILAFTMSGVSSYEEMLGGFATQACFIVLLGMVITSAMEKTTIPSRVVYFILSKLGGLQGGTLASILLLPTILSFFVPASAIRTTLLIPVVHKILKWQGKSENGLHAKQYMMGLAVGANISGIVVVTAAPSNLITVELINSLLHVRIDYLDWLILMLPLWMLLIPLSWILLTMVYTNVRKAEGQMDPAEMSKMSEELGPLTSEDHRFVWIITITVLLWFTQPLHQLPLVFPAFFAAFLLGIPKIGVMDWKQLSHFDFNLFLLVGTTVSMAQVLQSTGTMEWITTVMQSSILAEIMTNPIWAILAVTIVTQIYHLVISNVNTAVITFLPVVVGLSTYAGADSLVLALVMSISSMLGFLLAIESLSNYLVFSTGMVSQRDFLKSGTWMTLIAIVSVSLLAILWWPTVMR